MNAVKKLFHTVGIFLNVCSTLFVDKCFVCSSEKLLKLNGLILSDLYFLLVAVVNLMKDFFSKKRRIYHFRCVLNFLFA